MRSLDDGTFRLGERHAKGDGPSFDEEFSAFLVNETKIYLKSGFGKYLTVDGGNLIVGRSDAAGEREIFEPIWEDGRMAIQASNNCFMHIDPEDGQLVAFKQSIKSADGTCVIRSNAFRGEIVPKTAPIEEKIQNLTKIEIDYVKKFQKFQNKKMKLCQDGKRELKVAKESGKLHESLLDRRSKMKSDRYCK